MGRPEIIVLAGQLGHTVTECVVEHLGAAKAWERLTSAELERLEIWLEAQLERAAIVEESARVVLVDGHNLLYRAFYAAQQATVAAFSRQIRAVMEALGPDLALVVFDAGGDSGRSSILRGYKATRQPTPEALVQQYPAARQAVDDLGIRRVEDPRWEADDLLASYARAARRACYSVVVVTSDKDLLQLCDDPLIQIYDTKRRALLGSEHAEEVFGVPARLLGDLLGMAGDSSDNVPGIPGIGPKTAAALLREHGTLEAVLAAAPSMREGKRRTQLLEHAAAARLSRRVVALREDLPLPIPLAELSPRSRPAPRRASHKPAADPLRVRKVLFAPEGSPRWVVPVAALQQHADGRVTVHETPRPKARLVGGASKLALLDLEMAYVRAASDFGQLHRNVGPHFLLGPACEAEIRDPAQWAALPVLVDERFGEPPRPARNIGPGTALGSHGYLLAKYSVAQIPNLARRWLWAQIQAGGRVFEELRSIEPGEHLAAHGEPYGPEVVKAWAWLKEHGL